MDIDWKSFEDRYKELSEELLSPNLDRNRRQVVQKELSQITELLENQKIIEKLQKTISETKSSYEQTQEPEMRQLFEEELSLLQKQLKEKEQEQDNLLYPADELDPRSVFLEIRSGAGGKEAALFVADLLRMYTNYALKRNWGVEVLSTSQTDLGGFREAILHIKGKDIYKHLKHESGVHRVQRVPETEASGRIHTSTATVAVLPEVEEVEFHINPDDLRIDVFRASGAGGQHVNTTDSAVRITHIPTGAVVSCQDERSQHKNKAKALKILRARLLAHQKEEHEEKTKQQRKEQVGTGMRAEKVRTYNYPQNRVTDHQVDLTLKKLDMVMEGYLDEIIDALVAKDQHERRKQFLIS